MSIKRNGDRSSGDDKIRELKKIIEALKRDKAQLQKELNKQIQFVAEAKNALMEKDIQYVETPAHKRKGDEGHGCPKCKEGVLSLRTYDLPKETKTVTSCDTCQYRDVKTVKHE